VDQWLGLSNGKIDTPEHSSDNRGSKQAVLKHFGVFRGDADIDEQLAGLRAQRESEGK